MRRWLPDINDLSCSTKNGAITALDSGNLEVGENEFLGMVGEVSKVMQQRSKFNT